jgi:aryl-phospho-beta-D-glucosidase BglC (GH1 family)
MNSCTLRSFIIALTLLLTLSASSQGLKRNGQKMVDQFGNEVILRGMGLGGWMLQEPYMMEMSGIASAQWEIKLKIQDLIGAAGTAAFYDAWHANHCTRKDIDSMASWGFNSVRLPMHFNLYTLPIEDEPVAGNQTWIEKGFAMTDSLIKWCAANHMYVILDLHAAPGGQGKDYAICDGNPAKPSLWDNAANKQKTIALWRKLAERYVNEPWVGGYDLINEPNWSFTTGGNQNGCSENSNAPLRQLLVDITTAIRQVDANHMIIIEGNCWGNNYNGMFPLWDANMALSFHKYWSYNDQGSIQGIVSLRNQYNVPIWLGESGENSNVWFTDAISLVEKNKIGWAWWPLKKIGSVVNPMTIVKTSEYQTLLDYWKNGGVKPQAGFATYTLMQMATNAKTDNCIYRKDVTDAMFRQVGDSGTIPYTHHAIPGTIHASDYDLGRCGKAYFDTDIATYQVSNGTYTAWNSGYSYRNDGVDIEATSDPIPTSNGYDVGWTVNGEWLQYTATVDSTAAYNVQMRYAGPAGSIVKFLANETDITGSQTVPSSGGYQNWNVLNFTDVVLYKGTQKLKFLFEKGGINLGFFTFSISKALADVSLKPVSAETDPKGEQIIASFNKKLDVSTVGVVGFSCNVNGTAAAITNLVISSSSAFQVVITMGKQIYDGDTILLSYSGGQIRSTDGSLLESFTNLPVKNNLPLNLRIPGKIEAEAFSINQGFQFETTTDAGGGQNMGFTHVGDYLDYRIKVLKTAKYNMEIRVASNSSAGIIQVQQTDDQGTLLNTTSVNLPVTGGWQTWKSIVAEVPLTEGIGNLRIKVLKTEFNLNWYKFAEKGVGIQDPTLKPFVVFPNPGKGEVTLQCRSCSGRPASLSFQNLNGIIVKSMNLPGMEESQKINVDDLLPGFYLLELETEGTTYRTKLIVQ